MNGPTTPLTKERMEDMLADYAFNALPEEETRQFEQSLPQYPEMQEEIRRIREAFAQFDKEDFLERQTRPARTLSVHVQERLGRKQKGFGSRSIRHLWPAATVAVLIAFMFAPGGFFYRSGPSEIAGTPASAQQPSLVASVVTAQSVQQLVDDVKAADPIDIALGMPEQTTMGDVDVSSDLAMADDGVFGVSDELAEGLADNALFPMSDYSLSDGLYDDVKETEIQQLLEGIENDLL